MQEITIFNQSTITFALHYAEYFFKKLRENYMKLSLGGYCFYETDLEKLVTDVTRAMPEGSAEEDAFLEVGCVLLCSMPDDYQKGPEAAAALNTLSNKLFRKDLVPNSSEITVEYLMHEMIHNDFGRFPAYEKWLRRQLKYKRRSANLSTYINNAAKVLHDIVQDDTHTAYQEFMELLEKLSDNFPGIATSPSTEVTPIEDTLKDQHILYTLLHHALNYQLKNKKRSSHLIEILKLVEKYQPTNN